MQKERCGSTTSTLTNVARSPVHIMHYLRVNQESTRTVHGVTKELGRSPECIIPMKFNELEFVCVMDTEQNNFKCTGSATCTA